MEWYLILTLFSTTDVLVREFKTESACRIYLSAHQAEYKRDKDIKSAMCGQGAILDQVEKSTTL
jgi:hypothetical protein